MSTNNIDGALPRVPPQKAAPRVNAPSSIQIDLACVSCYNTRAELYFQLQDWKNQKQKQPCKRGKKSVCQHWLFSFCTLNCSLWLLSVVLCRENSGIYSFLMGRSEALHPSRMPLSFRPLCRHQTRNTLWHQISRLGLYRSSEVLKGHICQICRKVCSDIVTPVNSLDFCVSLPPQWG